MRYDRDHKERTRRKVLGEAAVAIREVGPDRIGVAGLMAEAGLTHGGFYAHFKSKDALVAEAITEMFDQGYHAFLSSTGGPNPAAGLARFVDRYLSTRHRDKPGEGCPMPSLSGDVARLPAAARKRFAAGAARLTNSIAELLESIRKPNARDLAASIVAEMVGAMALARAVADPTQSARILEASRKGIKARLAVAPLGARHPRSKSVQSRPAGAPPTRRTTASGLRRKES